MTERIAYPDIEKTLVDFFTAQLAAASDTATVVTRVPDPAPARMLRIYRDDRKRRLDREDREGRRGPYLILDRPRVVFECSDTAGDAAGLAVFVRAVLSGTAPGYLGDVWCDCIEDVGVETDIENPAMRQIITADLVVRGEVLA
ncbi:hypothetical protein ACWDSJ_13060 [Nocardia sp. NPDC003482]